MISVNGIMWTEDRRWSHTELKMALMNRRFFIPAATASGLAPAWLLAAARPERVQVLRGDTLTRISRRHGLSVTELRLWNGLTSDLIQVGQEIWLKPRYTQLPLAKITQPRIKAGRWKNIITHHSATPNGSAAIFDEYHRVAQGREHGLAYHFVIGNGTNSPDGKVEVGGRWLKQANGGHVRSAEYNSCSIGICLVGNFEKTQPSTKQIKSLIELSDYLKHRMFRGRLKFFVHKELEKTLCPGRHFPLTRFHQLFS